MELSKSTQPASTPLRVTLGVHWHQPGPANTFAGPHVKVVQSRLSHCWHRTTSHRLEIGLSGISFSMWSLISPGARAHPTDTQAQIPQARGERTHPVTAAPPDPGLLRTKCKCSTGRAPKLGNLQWFQHGLYKPALILPPSLALCSHGDSSPS